MKTNKEKFIESYSRRMRTHSAANPGLYVVPESWTERAETMANAFAIGNGLLTVTAKATLKELGAEPTLQGAKDYLTN